MSLMTCVSERRRTALTFWLVVCLALTFTAGPGWGAGYESDAGAATVQRLLAPGGEHTAPLALASGIRHRSSDGSTRPFQSAVTPVPDGVGCRPEVALPFPVFEAGAPAALARETISIRAPPRHRR